MNYFIGIDGGVSGAWAIISEDLKEVEVYKWPKELSDLVDLFEDILEEREIALVALERQQAAPRQRASSVFTLGENYGMWQAAFAFMRLPYIIVAPKVWMYKTFDSIKRKEETKTVSLAHAKRRFPMAPIGKDHNKADAVNIALYARNKYVEG